MCVALDDNTVLVDASVTFVLFLGLNVDVRAWELLDLGAKYRKSRSELFRVGEQVLRCVLANSWMQLGELYGRYEGATSWRGRVGKLVVSALLRLSQMPGRTFWAYRLAFKLAIDFRPWGGSIEERIERVMAEWDERIKHATPEELTFRREDSTVLILTRRGRWVAHAREVGFYVLSSIRPGQVLPFHGLRRVSGQRRFGWWMDVIGEPDEAEPRVSFVTVEAFDWLVNRGYVEVGDGGPGGFRPISAGRPEILGILYDRLRQPKAEDAPYWWFRPT
ncbi:MAG: hypothetical protein D6790_04075, partial [Caldilineae bacterium]